ncbi:MAG: hypothetical protein JNM63_09820 [Spirochaetia bacterium]|nr:hypothetical protein [Spirochaetia bacterium]
MKKKTESGMNAEIFLKNRLCLVTAGLLAFILSACFSTERNNPFDSASTNGVVKMTLEKSWNGGLGAVFFPTDEAIYSRGFSNGMVLRKWSWDGAILRETNTGMTPDNEGIVVIGSVVFVLSNQGFVRFDKDSFALLAHWIPAALTIDEFAVDTNATGETNFYFLIGGSVKRFVYPGLSAVWSRSISANDVVIGSDFKPVLFRTPENAKLVSYEISDGTTLTTRSNFHIWNGRKLDLGRVRQFGGDYYFSSLNTAYYFFRLGADDRRDFLNLDPAPVNFRSYRVLAGGKIILYADGKYSIYKKAD